MSDLLSDLDLIWHSVSDDKESNAAYNRLCDFFATGRAVVPVSEPTVSAREICTVRDALRLHNLELTTGAICDIIFALKRVPNVPSAL